MAGSWPITFSITFEKIGRSSAGDRAVTDAFYLPVARRFLVAEILMWS
jgi:hypothetical protein